MKKLEIHCDGSCLNNPGSGGWAFLIIKKNSKMKVGKLFSGRQEHTTNNRMELTASIMALSLLKSKSEISLYSDSLYLIKGANEWIKKWTKENWKKNSGKYVKNVDLWKELAQKAKEHKIQWNWIRGHSDNEKNKVVDKEARKLALKK